MSKHDILNHEYPSWLRRYPKLIYLLYGWHFLMNERVQRCHKQLKILLTDTEYNALDVGSGEGYFSHLVLNAHKSLTSLDISQENLSFQKDLFRNRLNVSFIHSDINVRSLENPYDLIICIGVLQYIEEDKRALAKMRQLLADKGRILLYVPVENKIVFQPYRRLLDKNLHYDAKNQKCQSYTKKDLLKKIADCGLDVGHLENSYGTLGIWGHNVYQYLLLQFLYGNLIKKIGIGLAAIVLIPLIILSQWIDAHLRLKNGNGMLLVLEKKVLT